MTAARTIPRLAILIWSAALASATMDHKDLKSQFRFLLPALGLHLLVMTLPWRDISRRGPAQLRGSKALWRAVMPSTLGTP